MFQGGLDFFEISEGGLTKKCVSVGEGGLINIHFLGG